MNNIKKLMILATCFVATTATFAKSSTKSSAPASAQSSSTQSAAPKPMATALPTTGYYATNTSTYNASVIFYDASATQQTSATNVPGKSQIGFPVGAGFISIKSGDQSIYSIKAATNYMMMYNSTTKLWSFTAMA